MKKIIILIVLVTSYSNIFALLTQANWRWRNDDGNETTATWKAAQNTQVSLSTTGQIWRLRIELYNSTGGTYPFYDTLQYATSTGGPWTNIELTAGSNAFKIADTSAFVVQDEPTTAQLAGTAYPFSPGKIIVDSTTATNLNLADSSRTEIEWAIMSTPNIQPNTVYYFREQWGQLGGFSIDGSATYPSLLTLGVLSVRLSNFTASREGEKAKLEWTAASKQNVSRFDVLRSSDGRTWKTITSVKGNISAASNTYKIYDESPLSGSNYYVIKQYDVDGHSYQSEAKFLRMPDIKSIISVYPNPARSGVNFSIANKGTTNLEALLTNINGTIIHREIFPSAPANTVNKLNLKQQPTPGIYILKLKAEGISESVRVVIE